MGEKYNIPMSKEFKERAFGYTEFWNCSLAEFIAIVSPEMKAQKLKNQLSDRVIKTAAGFLRIKFDNKELKGTIKYEVTLAIDEALVYYVNVLGEDE